jgi:two-component sensor histidine kinase
MVRATEVLRDVSQVEYVVVALVALWQWRRHRVPGAGWAAVSFTVLAVVVGLSRLLPHVASLLSIDLFLKGLLALLLVFPYCLYRFAASFLRPPAWIRWSAAALTLGVVAATFALEYVPLQGMPRPPWFLAYRSGIGVQWGLLFLFVTVRLWRAGAGEPAAVRTRMRLLAAGTAGMNLQIIVGVLGLSVHEPVALVNQAMSAVMAILFAVGLAPPIALRMRWRRSDGDLFRAAVADLVGSTSAESVANGLLPHVARLVGASGAALIGEDGTILASHGEVPEHGGGNGDGREEPGAAVATSVPTRRGRSERLVVWTTPYTPFFGDDELRVLASLGDWLGLAMERCALAEYERQFIANAAHEFRTPLTVLSGLASTLSARRHELDDAQVTECLDAMERHGERARLLANNLLDLAKAERGNLDVHLEDVALADLVAAVHEAVPPPGGKRIFTAVDDDLVIRTDPMRFEQVLINLVSNAYRYGGPTVEVGAEVDTSGRVVLWVSDDGPGVPADLVDHLFEPFARGPHTNGEGSGLGLAITRRLVEALGGKVSYEPGRPRGSRFVVTLPLGRRHHAAEPHILEDVTVA